MTMTYFIANLGQLWVIDIFPFAANTLDNKATDIECWQFEDNIN